MAGGWLLTSILSGRMAQLNRTLDPQSARRTAGRMVAGDDRPLAAIVNHAFILHALSLQLPSRFRLFGPRPGRRVRPVRSPGQSARSRRRPSVRLRPPAPAMQRVAEPRLSVLSIHPSGRPSVRPSARQSIGRQLAL